MPNALFNALGNNNNPFSNIIQQAQQLKNTFKGNPKQEVERLIKSGQMSQEQFNQYSQIANQIMQMMK